MRNKVYGYGDLLEGLILPLSDGRKHQFPSVGFINPLASFCRGDELVEVVFGTEALKIAEGIVMDSLGDSRIAGASMSGGEVVAHWKDGHSSAWGYDDSNADRHLRAVVKLCDALRLQLAAREAGHVGLPSPQQCALCGHMEQGHGKWKGMATDACMSNGCSCKAFVQPEAAYSKLRSIIAEKHELISQRDDLLREKAELQRQLLKEKKVAHGEGGPWDLLAKSLDREKDLRRENEELHLHIDGSIKERVQFSVSSEDAAVGIGRLGVAAAEAAGSLAAMDEWARRVTVPSATMTLRFRLRCAAGAFFRARCRTDFLIALAIVGAGAGLFLLGASFASRFPGIVPLLR